MVAIDAGPLPDGRRRRVGLRQRAAAPRGRVGAVPDRSQPRDERRVPGVRRGRRLRRSPPVGGRGVGVAPASPEPMRRSSGHAKAAATGRGGASGDGKTSRPTSPCSTSPGTRPTRSRGGAAPGCPPRRSGRRRRRWRASRAVPAACSAVSGSGPPPTSTDIPASRRSRTASTPKCSSGPSTRCSVAVRGRRDPSVRPRGVPQLGLPDPPPDLRRLPLRGGRMSHVPTPRLHRSAGDAREAAAPAVPLLAAPGIRAAVPDARDDQPRRLRCRLVRPRPRAEPARYRTTEPIWSDASFESISGLVKSNAVLAAVRAASPGMPIEERANAPFTEGPWLFSHNGFVPGFRSGVGRALRRKVSDATRRCNGRRDRLRAAVRARARPSRLGEIAR